MINFRRLAIVTTGTTLLLASVGGLVRATESGLGCPDWPTCHGRVTPPSNSHSIIEFSHRLVAAIVIAMCIALAVTAWRRYREHRGIVGPAMASVFIVFGQAGLGALVVALDLDAESVVAHLLVAMSLLAVLIALTANIVFLESPELLKAPPFDGDSRGHGTPDLGFARSARYVAAATLALMLIGSYVSGREAGLAFPDWPLFDGRLLPQDGGLVPLLHASHRLAAAIVGVAVVWLASRSRRTRQNPAVVRLTTLGAAAFAVQVLLGAANVWTELSEATRTAHLAVGAIIWGLLFAAAYTAQRLPAGDAPVEADAAPPGTVLVASS